jgi:hypothetical protein
MNNNNLYKRPMFRKGGSAEGGITSGLQSPRQGYALPGTVQQNDTSRQRIIDAMGRAPQGRNFNDFLINFGLDIASRSPMGSGIGGAISTIAESAKSPYEKFAKANQAEQNLLRQVGMEAEIMDINKENAAAAAAAKEAGAMSRLEKQIQADKDLYDLEKGENLNSLITTRAQESIADGKFNNYNAATNEAEWTFRGSKEYKDRIIGGVLSEKQSNDSKSQAKFAKSQGKKKNGVGKIYYDPYKDQVLEVAVVEGDYVLRPVGGGEEVMDTIKEVVEKKSGISEKDKNRIKDSYGFYLPDVIEDIRKKDKEIPFGGTGA